MSTDPRANTQHITVRVDHTPSPFKVALVWLVLPLRYPASTVLTAAALSLLLRWGWLALLATAAGAAVALAGWRRAHPGSFDVAIARRWLATWRRWWVYQRSWRAAMACAGLDRTAVEPAVPFIVDDPRPRIVKSRYRPAGDELLIKLLAGQRVYPNHAIDSNPTGSPAPPALAEVTDHLAGHFDQSTCRIIEVVRDPTSTRGALVWLRFASTGQPSQHPGTDLVKIDRIIPAPPQLTPAPAGPPPPVPITIQADYTVAAAGHPVHRPATQQLPAHPNPQPQLEASTDV